MLCKAIIDEVIDTYRARVRIPIYHQIEKSSFATKREDLPIASICSIPGITFALREGDVVFVDFELDQLENPVIMGCLSRNNSTSSSNIDAQSISIKVNCNLPEDTYLAKEDELNKINFENIVETIANTSSDGVAKFG